MVRLYDDSQGIFVGVYRYDPPGNGSDRRKCSMIRISRTNEKQGVDSMKVISGIKAYNGDRKTAVTLGKFDGLHRGHQKLLRRSFPTVGTAASLLSAL